MWHKVIAGIEVWIGLSFLVMLFGYIPAIGPAVAGVISSIIGIVASIPFYGFIIAVLGTVLFVDGVLKFFH